jgi:hypothetical protein
MSIFDGLRAREDDSNKLSKELAQLVSSLQTKQDIELKTEIFNPLAIARLREFASWGEREGLVGIGKITEVFIQKYLEYMVSYNRQGRAEVVRAISEMHRQEIKRTIMGKEEVEP